MSKIKWDQVGERRYEMGDKKCVLYVYDSVAKDYGNGVAWNGITAITESPSGAEAEDLWADDIKYATLRSAEQLGGTIEAYTYPDEFEQCNGEVSVSGVVIGMQKRAMFGLSYVTSVGNDVDTEAGYKLHLVWGCTASPSERSYQTVNDSPEAITFSWEFSTNPVEVTIDGKSRTTSILTIDTSKFKAEAEELKRLATLENILYGMDGEKDLKPDLPTPDEVISIMSGTVPDKYNDYKADDYPEAVSTSSYRTGLTD